MQPSEILKQIKPCNLDEPFVFISYSSLDAQRVWEDVLRFQQMGYNMWLDEKNLDKTQASWRDDALEAIRDFNCSLLVFYVSRNSLVSQACFSELECTVEDITRRIHNGPVKFIAVDAEPINDIIQLQDEVHGEIRRNKEITKDEKRNRAITLSCCIEQFFNSNNEKVRVKAMGLPNRKMDYYEEIVAAFPDETCILPVEESEEEKIAAPELAPTEMPVVTVELGPVVGDPKPAEAPMPEVAAAPVKEPTVQQKRTVPPKEEKPVQAVQKKETKTLEEWLHSDDSRGALWNLHRDAIDNANRELKKNHSNCFKQSFNLSTKQRENAIKHITNEDRWNCEVEALLDTTLMDSGKSGILIIRHLINDERILHSSYNPGTAIPLVDVVDIQNGRRENNLYVRLRNGMMREFYFSIYTEGVRALLKTYAEAPYQTLRDEQEEEQARQEKHRQEYGFGGEKSQISVDVLPTSPTELAKLAMAEANREIDDWYGHYDDEDEDEDDSGTYFLPAEEMTPQQLKAVAKEFQIKEAAVLGGLGVNTDGEKWGEAWLLTRKKLVYHGYTKTTEIPICELTKIEESRKLNQLVLTYEDGSEQDVDMGLHYLGIRMLLQVYIAANQK